MRELLYLSQSKLQTFVGPTRWTRQIRGGVEVSALGFKISAISAANSDNHQVNDEHLDAVIRYLEKISVGDHTTANIKLLDWIKFDLEMCWATSYRDSGPPLDDIVLFANIDPTHGHRSDADHSHVDFLLCGSREHLLNSCESCGRMGSETEWLYDLIVYLESGEHLEAHRLGFQELESHGITADTVDHRLRLAAGFAHSVIQGHHPRRQRSHLSGLAKVLFTDENDSKSHRLIVATPLYVEVHHKRRRQWRMRLQ